MTTHQTKVAVITGSGKRRIGYHVAHALAQRGYALVVHYRTSKAEAEDAVNEFQKLGVQAIAVQADLTNEQEANGLIDAALTQFGRIDLLVHCAAEWQKKPLEEVTAVDLRSYFEINTLATSICSLRAGLAMVKQPDGGCIITLGDWATERPYLDYLPYFVSKGSITTLTRTLAVEMGSRNPAIRVNCIMPGPVMLPLDLPEAERQEAIAGTLVKREGSPEDVVRAVIFLAESPFITGVCLPVDGGRSIYAPESQVATNRNVTPTMRPERP